MEYICLDIECTGLNKDEDEIIEIAACRFNNTKIIDEFSTFVSHKKLISEKIQNLTGISNQMTEGAPELASILPQLKTFIADLPILGHNIQFDIGFLNANQAEIQNPTIDSLPLSHMLFASEESFSLEVLCQKYNKTYLPSHRAMDDVKANIELYWVLLKQKENFQPAILQFLANQLQNTAYFDLFDTQAQAQTEFINPKHQEIQSIETQESQNQGNHLFELPQEFKANQILVKNIHSSLEISNSFTFIPNKLEFFDIEKLSQDLQSQDFELEQKLTLLKIIIKYANHKVLHSLNVNYRMDEITYFKDYLRKFPGLPIAHDKPYLCSFETFFYLNHHNLLPANNEAYLEFDPFMAEGYLNAITETIYVPKELESQIADIFVPDGILLEPYQKVTLNPFINKEISDILPEAKNFLNDTDSISMIYRDYFNMLIVKIPNNIQITVQNIFNQIKIPHHFVIPDNPNFQIQIHNKAPHFKSPNFKEAISSLIYQDLTNNNFQQTIILSNSKDHIRTIFANLESKCKEIGITLLGQDESGSKSKILSKIRTNESPTILLCTYQFLQKFSPEFSKVDKVYITSLPFHTISHFYFDHLKKQADNEFMEVLIPECSSNLIKLSYFLHSKYNVQELSSFDDRLITQRYGSEISNLIQNYISISSF